MEECMCCKQTILDEKVYKITYMDDELRVCLECYIEEERLNSPSEDPMDDLADELADLKTK